MARSADDESAATPRRTTGGSRAPRGSGALQEAGGTEAGSGRTGVAGTGVAGTGVAGTGVAGTGVAGRGSSRPAVHVSLPADRIAIGGYEGTSASLLTREAEDRTALSQHGREIARALAAVLEQVLDGGEIRQTPLTQRLGLDATLAGKLVRAARAAEPLATLHHLPGVAGLRLLVEAAERADVPKVAPSLESLRAAVDRHEQITRNFRGGRAGLEAALAGHLPEVQERNERSARQAMYRAASAYVGCQVEADVFLVLMQPAPDDPETLDLVFAQVKHGLRRLRPGGMLAAFGCRFFDRTAAGQAAGPELCRLDGTPARGVADWRPEDFVLRDFCRGKTALEVRPAGPNEAVLCLPGGEAVGRPVTLAFARQVRRLYQRRASADRLYEWTRVVPRIPARRLVVDCYVHQSLLPGFQPVSSRRLFGVTDMRGDGPHNPVDDLGRGPVLDPLGGGEHAPGAADLPNHDRLVAHAFAVSGWHPEEFEGWRMRVNHPGPGVAYILWHALQA